MRIDRRAFLSASIAAMSIGLPQIVLSMNLRKSSAPPFYGNPNVTIDAISVDPNRIFVTGMTSLSNQPHRITNLSSTAELQVGHVISGTNISANTVIRHVDAMNSSILISNPVVGSGATTLACGGNNIACSRLTGQVPAFFQVSASLITASGTDNPYEDLEYRWDFGDQGGIENFIRPTDKVTVNANTDQIGPEAAYVYRTPGTYKIKLTIRARNSADSFIVATVSQTIKVSAFNKSSGELWFDSVNGSDTNTGRSARSPKRSISAIQAFLSSNANSGNKAIHLACGSMWAGINQLNLTAISAVRIDSYIPPQSGATAQPEFHIIGGSNLNAISMTNGSGSAPVPRSDYVISNVKAQCSGTSTQGAPFSIRGVAYHADDQGTLTDIYLDNCTSTSNSAGPLFDSSNSANFNFACWNCVFSVIPGEKSTGLYGSARNWQAFVGCSFSGDGTNAILDHYIYPECQNHSLYKWASFSPNETPAAKNYCVNTNWNTVSGGLEFVEYTCFSECLFSGALRSHDAGESARTIATFSSGDPKIGISRYGYASFPTIGQQIIFLSFPGPGRPAVLPANIASGNPYFVVASGRSGTSGFVQISGTKGGIPITPTGGSSGSQIRVLLTQYRFFVAERNAYVNLGGDGVILFDEAQTMTVRDNRIWNCRGGRWYAPDSRLGYILQSKLYRNLIYISPAASRAACISYEQPFVLPQQLTHNVIRDDRSEAAIVSMPQAPHTGTLVDNNQYYAPNDDGTTRFGAGRYLFVGSKALTFAEWQSWQFDINGSVTATRWDAPPTQWSSFDSK